MLLINSKKQQSRIKKKNFQGNRKNQTYDSPPIALWRGNSDFEANFGRNQQEGHLLTLSPFAPALPGRTGTTVGVRVVKMLHSRGYKTKSEEMREIASLLGKK